MPDSIKKEISQWKSLLNLSTDKWQSQTQSVNRFTFSLRDSVFNSKAAVQYKQYLHTIENQRTSINQETKLCTLCYSH